MYTLIELKKGFKVSSNNELHKPWHSQAPHVSIIHYYTVKAIICNGIFYEAPIDVCSV